MIFIDVKGEIINGEYASWMNRWLGEDEQYFSLDAVRKAINDTPDETDICLNMDSYGGDIQEALNVYDYLRSLSGKSIYSNIIGECSSAATVIALAAPKKNRSGNAHCYSVLHFVSGGAYGKVEDVEKVADLMHRYNSQLLDIYAERTGTAKKRLSEVMDKDERSMATDLLSLGFISTINAHATASAYAIAIQGEIYKGRIAAMAKSNQVPEPPKPVKESSLNTLLKIF